MAVLSAPTNTPTTTGASLTIDSDSDLGTLYSYSKTTAFTGTDEENATEIIAQGVGQAPVVGTNTRVVTGQDGMTPHYAGWVQDTGAGAIYYVKTDGDDAATGLSDALAWKTIEKVNGATLSPGDTVLLNKGDTWRERIYVPASGSTGNHITFGSYGTGAKPVLNAASLLTGWTDVFTYTNWVGSGETVLLDKSTSVGQIAFANGSSRVWQGQGSWTPDSDFTINSVEIDLSGAVGSPSYDLICDIYSQSGTALETLLGSSAPLACSSTGVKKLTGLNVDVTTGGTYAIVFRRSDNSFDASNFFFIRIDDAGDTWSGAYDTFQADKARTSHYGAIETGLKLYASGGSPYYATYEDDPASVTHDGTLLTENTTSLASLATGEWWNDTGNTRTYVFDDPTGVDVTSPDDYHVPYTQAPKQVFSDDTLLLENRVSKETLATGEWFNDITNSRVYVYDDPAGAVMEGGYWSMCVHFNNKSYITVQDLALHKSNGNNVWIDTASGGFDDLIVRRCTIKWAHSHGIGAGLGGFSTTGHGISTGLQILNNELSLNGFGGTQIDGGTGFAINISGNSPTDYIEQVLVQGNSCIGDYSGIKGDWFSNDVLFKNNYIEVAHTPFSTDAGRDLTWEGNIVNGCGVNESAINLFYWEGPPGPPYSWGYSEGLTVIQNTIYGCKRNISLADTQTNTVVKNNVIQNNFSDGYLLSCGTGITLTGLDIDNNSYYSGANALRLLWTDGAVYSTLADWRTATGQDASAIDEDPLLVDPDNGDFSVTSLSPTIDAGADVGVTVDYAGVTEDSPWIGAYSAGDGN